MSRIPLLHVALLAASVGLALVACGGKVDATKDGTGSDKLQSINPSNVSGAVGACPAGYQHPNVCCSGGPSQASQCGAYVQHPFRACDPGWSTHPNPLTCCSLADGSCIDAPSGSVDPAPPTCGLVCPPGWWPYEGASTPGYDPGGPAPTPIDAGTAPDDPPPGSNNAGSGGSATGSSGPGASSGSGGVNGTTGSSVQGCCQYQPNGGVVCYGEASASPVPSPPDPSNCAVAYDPSTGTEVDAGCPTTPPNPYPPSPTPAPPCASACPDGWDADPAVPAACCRTTPFGTRECFVNGAPPIGAGPGDPEPAPAPVDAGTAPWPTGISCGGAQGGGCGCHGSSGGHTYDITCEDPSGCACLVDGAEVRHLPNAASNCQTAQTRLDQLWESCGFN